MVVSFKINFPGSQPREKNNTKGVYIFLKKSRGESEIDMERPEGNDYLRLRVFFLLSREILCGNLVKKSSLVSPDGLLLCFFSWRKRIFFFFSYGNWEKSAFLSTWYFLKWFEFPVCNCNPLGSFSSLDIFFSQTSALLTSLEVRSEQAVHHDF